MTREEAIEVLQQDIHCEHDADLIEALEMAIKALEILEEFEKAQIITGGRLNGRTYAYKCGLEDGKRKALEQEPPKQDCKNCKHYADDNETCLECEYDGITRGYTRYEQEPSGDTVSRGVFEQVRWERDIAIEQLHELGYGLGQKIESSGDAVSRQVVKEQMIKYGFHALDMTVTEFVEDLPSVNPQTGHWIKTIGENGVTSAVRCSECGFEDNRYMLFRYCPNCGAKMESEDEDGNDNREVLDL